MVATNRQKATAPSSRANKRPCEWVGGNSGEGIAKDAFDKFVKISRLGRTRSRFLPLC